VLVQHIGAIPYRSPVLRAAMGVANRLATRPLLGRASQAVFISDAVRRQFPDVRFRKAPKLLFNGVDHALFRAPLPGEAARLRVGLGLSETRPKLLFVGRFVEKKGLASLRALAAARPNWDLLLAGGGPIDPAAWQLANVRVLGRKSRNELAELYRAAHALVLPSVGEGFPLVIQEAMASGLPVFCGLDSAAADPDAASFLHGIPVDPSDPAGTAARFAQAIAEAPLEPDPIMAAYARAAYDWDGNARWLVQAISNSRA
jgi:glycosyltransferase involved in cell wall biosynthesis